MSIVQKSIYKNIYLCDKRSFFKNEHKNDVRSSIKKKLVICSKTVKQNDLKNYKREENLK